MSSKNKCKKNNLSSSKHMTRKSIQVQKKRNFKIWKKSSKEKKMKLRNPFHKISVFTKEDLSSVPILLVSIEKSQKSKNSSCASSYYTSNSPGNRKKRNNLKKILNSICLFQNQYMNKAIKPKDLTFRNSLPLSLKMKTRKFPHMRKSRKLKTMRSC